MKRDTPIDLATIKEMSDDEVDKLVGEIRERRLKPVHDYEESQAVKAMYRRAGLDKQLAQHQKMFEKELARADTIIDKLEARARKLRGLKLELELIEEAMT